LRDVRLRQRAGARVDVLPGHPAPRRLLRLLLRHRPDLRGQGRSQVDPGERAGLHHARDLRRRHADRLLGLGPDRRPLRAPGGRVGDPRLDVDLALAGRDGLRDHPALRVLLRRRQGGPEGGLSVPARLIEQPTIVQSAGNKPKRIEEFVGLVNSATPGVSVARMTSPTGWVEPGQTPQFDEFTLVLRGTLRVETHGGTLEVQAGQAVVAPRGEWVRYSTPHAEGAEYVAVCVPAFSPETVRRDD